MPDIIPIKSGEKVELPDVCLACSGSLVELRHAKQSDWVQAIVDFERLLLKDAGLVTHFNEAGVPGRILNLVIPGATLHNCMAVQTTSHLAVGGYVFADGEWKEPLWFHNFNRLTALCIVLNIKNAQTLKTIFDKHAAERPPPPPPRRPTDSTVH